MYKVLKKPIEKKSEYYARKYRNKRISREDFESALWEETWRLADLQAYDDSNFLLFETLQLAWDRRAIDVVRKALKTKQGHFEHSISSLPDEFEEYYPDSKTNVEEEVLGGLTVKQMLSDPDLSLEEKRFLEALYNNPTASLRDLTQVVGNRHPQTAKRLLDRLRHKLAEYNVK